MKNCSSNFPCRLCSVHRKDLDKPIPDKNATPFDPYDEKEQGTPQNPAVIRSRLRQMHSQQDKPHKSRDDSKEMKAIADAQNFIFVKGYEILGCFF